MPKKYVVVRKEKKDQPVQLTSAELLDKSKESAILTRDIETTKVRQVSVKQELKSTLDRMEAHRQELSSQIEREEVYRPVEVECRLDFTIDQYVEIRMDTGEVIPGSSRPIRDDERQEHMEFSSK